LECLGFSGVRAPTQASAETPTFHFASAVFQFEMKADRYESVSQRL
jgi:hypothetical protein